MTVFGKKYDDNASQKDGVYNPTPDDDIFRHLASVYSETHPRMHKGLRCPHDPPTYNFVDGITNGAAWYVIAGGMQDYNYLVGNCFEVTLEVGCFKFPGAKFLPKFWAENREALVRYAQQAHAGVSGFVRDASGTPLSNVTISVVGIAKDVTTYLDGDYWRLLLPGTYQVTATKDGFEPTTLEVRIPRSATDPPHSTRLDFVLEPKPDDWSLANDFGLESNLRPAYMTNAALWLELGTLTRDHAEVTKRIVITVSPEEQIQGLVLTGAEKGPKLHVLLVGGAYGRQPAGRELLVRFARHLLEGHGTNEPRIAHLLRDAEIYLFPSLDPRGFEEGKEGECVYSELGQLGDEMGNNFVLGNAKSGFPEVEAVKQFFSSTHFHVALSLEAGSLFVRYPPDKQTDESEGDSDKSLRHLAESYARSHRRMMTSAPCGDKLPSGVRRGSDVLRQPGATLTDYLYFARGTLAISAHVSCCIHPKGVALPALWKDNLGPLLTYLGTALQGIRGRVLTPSGAPLTVSQGSKVEVYVEGRPKPLHLDLDGGFYATLPEGRYTVYATANGRTFWSETSVQVRLGAATELTIPFESSGADAASGESDGDASYHDYVDAFRKLANAYPNITQLYSIGKSAGNEEILVLRVTGSADSSLPARVKVVGGLHGNELLTTELVVRLATHLVRRYGADSAVTQLVDAADVHLLAALDPDVANFRCNVTSGHAAKMATVARGATVDIDTNFPVDESLSEDGTEPEPATRAVMNWLRDRHFALSISLHAGSLVVSYPLNRQVNGSSWTPDDDVFRYLASRYARLHPTMHLGQPGCAANPAAAFKDGVVNGAEWRGHPGSMQDYNYLRADCLELSVYVGCDACPASPVSTWRDNRVPLIDLLGQATRRGVTGSIRDSKGRVIPGSKVEIGGRRVLDTSAEGGFRWLLLPGAYALIASAPGHVTQVKSIVLTEDEPLVRVEFFLEPEMPEEGDTIFGFGRTGFVAFVGSVTLFCLVSTLIVTCCYYRRQRRALSRRKGFHALNGGGGLLFTPRRRHNVADDDDDGEGFPADMYVKSSRTANGGGGGLRGGSRGWEADESESEEEEEVYDARSYLVGGVRR